MKRLKLEHNYHDATVASFELRGGTLTIAVDLVPHSNHGSPERRHLIVGGLRNEADVRRWLDEHTTDARCEIIGIVRRPPRHVLIDLNVGALELDCQSVVET